MGVVVALVALSLVAAPAVAGASDQTSSNEPDILVDDHWSTKSNGEEVEDGYVMGENATSNITAAIDLADEGDKILVRDGIYEEQVTVDKSVRIVGKSGADPVVRFEPDSASGMPTIKVTENNTTIEELTVERIAADDRGSGSQPFAQGIRVSASDVVINDNDVFGIGFDDAWNKGIMVLDDESGGSGEVVKHVSVTENDVEGFHGAISVAANYGGNVSEVHIENNTFANNVANGVSMAEIDGNLDVTLKGYDWMATDATPDTTWHFKTEADALAFGGQATDAVVTGPNGHFHVGDGMSIQDAVDAASDGDKIVVHDGTYAGFMVKKQLTIKAADGETPVVDADEGITNDGVIAFRDTGGDADGSTVKGLTVDARGQSSYLVGISIAADDVTIRDVLVKGDQNVTGLQTHTGYDGNGSSGTLVTDSKFKGANVGISFQGGDDTATDNTIKGATLEGIGLASTTHTITGNDVSTVGDAPGIRIYTTTANEVAVSNMLLDENPKVESVAWNANGHVYERDVSLNGTYYHSIQAAVDAAQAGDTVHLADGTYDLSNSNSDRLDVTTSGITIKGESMDGVVLNGSDSPWPIYATNESDLTFKNFTLLGTQQSGSDDGIKVAFTEDLTIKNVAVEGSAGNEIDLNNVRDANLWNVHARGMNTGGVGVALSGVTDVKLDGVHTSGNNWGGVGLYDADVNNLSAPGGWTLMQNTSDVTVTKASKLTEPVSLYSDQEFGGTLGDLYAPAYHYAVQNPDFRENIDQRGEDFVFFKKTKSGAVSLALGLANNDSSTVQTLSKDDKGEIDLGPKFIVGSQGGNSMSIQTAVDAVEAGNKVWVGPGTYNEAVTIDKQLTLKGAGVGKSIIAPPSGTGLLVAGHTPASGGSVDDVTIKGFSVDSADGELGLAAFSETSSNDYDSNDLTVRNVKINGTDALGVGLFSSKNATLDQVTVHGVSDSSVGALELIGVKNLKVKNSKIADNALGINLFSVSGYGANGPVWIKGTTFTGNDVHVKDQTGVIDIKKTLKKNTFDKASAVKTDSGPLSTIWSTVQDGVDAAGDGDKVLLSGGPFPGTVNVTDTDHLTITSVDWGHAKLQPKTTIGVNAGGYGTNRATAFRVVNSTGFRVADVKIDFSKVADNSGIGSSTPIYGMLFWNTSGVVEDSTLKNLAVPESQGGYYEIGFHARAPDHRGDRLPVELVDNEFKNLGRVAVNTHEFVDMNIHDNTFRSTIDDFGYGIELGSESTGVIRNNEFSGYDTAAASDGSQSGAIYVENAFTSDVDAPLTKDVLVKNNLIHDNQIGVQFGQTWDGLSSNVTIDATLRNNVVRNNSVAGVVVTDENAKQNSSVDVLSVGNLIEDNKRGYWVMTQNDSSSNGDGDIRLRGRHDTIRDNHVGVLVENGGPESASDYVVDFRYSTFKKNDVAVKNTVDWLTVDATLNWFGSADGPSKKQFVGDVTYDPFLTNTPDKVNTDRDKLQQFGHDFVVPGDGEAYAVGFPTDVDETLGEVFGDFEGAVYAWDAEDEKWVQPDADTPVTSLDAVVVVAEEKVRYAIDYADATEPGTPGEADLESGWNFVAAPQQAGAETAFGATAGADVSRVIAAFDGPKSQPYGWGGDDFGTYTLGSTGHVAGPNGPTVSPFTGYWVYASDDGSLAGAGYTGITIADEIKTLSTQVSP